MMKRLLVVVAALLPALALAFLTFVSKADQPFTQPLFHFYIVTFTTFSAAVVSLLLAVSLGSQAQPRHILAATAFAVMGSIFFSHGLATPGALIDHVHPAVTWSAWLTLFGGGVLFACASLDGPHGLPRWLPIRGLINTTVAVVLLYSAIAAFFPEVLEAIQKQVNPWHQRTIFYLTLALWSLAAARLGWIWRKTKSQVDAVLAFVSFWMITATISMHLYSIWNYSWWLYHATLLLGFLITVVVLVRQYEQVRQFRLQRYYLGLSLIITALLALVASALFTQFSYNTLLTQLETSSSNVAINLSNGIASELPEIVTAADLQKLTNRPGLHPLVGRRSGGLPLKDIFIYDTQGLAVYANEPDWLGVKIQDPEKFAAALKGQTSIELHEPDAPPLTYQPSQQVHILETYTPVRPGGQADAQPIGVLVTVEEVPQLKAATLSARVTGLLTAVTTMGLLFLALLTVVGRADRILTARADELAMAYANLRTAETMRDDLTNMIVHDLRNPLTAISASLDFVGRFSDEAQAATRARMVNSAQSASNRMMGMIEDLLTVSKIESGQFQLQRQPTNVNDLLTQAITTFSAQSAADQKIITFNCLSGLTATFDAPLIRRVIENLVGNALKYTDAGKGVIQVLVAQDVQRLTFTIRDNGQGVPPEHKQRIFQKFVQLADHDGSGSLRKGAGLGLAFCSQVVQQHGGEIKIEDAPGGGSDFIFWLPQ